MWPERKVYTRIYGDPTLEVILRENGYRKSDLHGATIPAIRLGGSNSDDWLMPYIDAADAATLIDVHSKRPRFRLGSAGEWDVKVTQGAAEPAEEDTAECGNCGESISQARAEDTPYCQSCESDRWVCSNCDTDGFDSSDSYTSENGDTYCSRCYQRRYGQCEECNEEYRKDVLNTTDRIDRNVVNLCGDCGDDKMRCDQCHEIVDNDPDDSTCKECRGADETETETGR